MKKQIKLIPAFAAAMTAFSLSANGAIVIPVTSVTASGSGNYSGDTTKMTDGSNMNDNPTSGGSLVGDPSTWTRTNTLYQGEWQSTGSTNGVLYTPTSDNNKMGWVTFDLGSVEGLNELFMWNVHNGSTTEIRDYTIHFSDAALNLPGSSSVVDYAFSAANGWSAFGSFTMAATQSNGNGAEAVHDVSGNSARYIGIEILTNNGNYTDNGNGTASGRVGLSEFAVTAAAVPEPSSTALLGLGGLALIFRKRR